MSTEATTPIATGANPITRLREDLIHPDPLLDCLVEVCRLHGQAASRASLAAGLPLVQGRLNLELAERAAARAGMAARLQRLPLEKIDPATLPAILVLADNQACVLIGHDEQGRARVLLPATGQGAITLARADLAARYAGVALVRAPAFPLRQPHARRCATRAAATGSGVRSARSASSTATCSPRRRWSTSSRWRSRSFR